MKKCNFSLCCLAIIAFSAHAQSLYFPPLVGNTWQTTDPASLGFCPDRIDSLYAFLGSNDTKAFLLLDHGKIVLERYYGTFTQDSFWYWASAGKTMTALLVGQAQTEGILDIHEKTSAYLGTGWSNCTPEQENEITVWHQLTMTTGLDDNLPPTPQVPDPDNCTDPACLVYKADAGARWAYHNAPYRLLHDVIAAAGNVTINQYTKSHLLDPTGMKGLWIDHVFYSKARDMARFGLLALAKGQWNGAAVLEDSVYFYDMTHRSQNLNKSYGYLWWLNGQESFMVPSSQIVFPFSLIPNAPADMIAALGKNDQKIHVVPSKNWVIIRMGNEANDDSPVPIAFDNEMWAYINALQCSSSTAEHPARTQAFQLSPNPTATHWAVTPNLPSRGFVQVFNAQGKLVRATNITPIDVAGLPAGPYFLQIFNENGTPVGTAQGIIK